MFNFQGSELIIILLLALVVLGPEKLPDAMRRLGKLYADLKKMSSGFQEEFRAAVDEPVREIRDTANTLRDSVDFRKLADGERPEKPRSAEMASAEPAAAPTDDVPFSEHHGTSPGDHANGDTNESERPSAADERNAAILDQTSTPPAPPPPFSSSQSISAVPPTPREPPTSEIGGVEPVVEEPSPRLAPQIAVDGEHGLREARPATEDGAA